MQISNLNSYINTKLTRYLNLKFKPGKTNIITSPKNIKDVSNYLRGLALYLEGCKKFITDQNDFDEADAYYAAVVAYDWNDSKPLVRLGDYFNQVGDKYYWFYLASDPNFTMVMNLETYRRRTYFNSSVPTSYSNLMTSTLPEERFMYKDLSANTLEPYESVVPNTTTRLIKHDDVYQVILKEKLQPGTVVGMLFETPNIAITVSYDNTYTYVPVTSSANLNDILLLAFNLDLDDSTFMDMVRVLAPDLQVRSINNIRTEIVRQVNQTHDLRVVNNKLYEVKITHQDKIRDIDIYFYGDNPLDDFNKLEARLRYRLAPAYSSTEFTTILEYATPNTIFKLHLHKIGFENVTDILAYIPLDSRRFLYYHFGRQYITTPLTIAARTYGFNMVVPSHQSRYYNQELVNAIGYVPILPAKLKAIIESNHSALNNFDLYKQLKGLPIEYVPDPIDKILVYLNRPGYTTSYLHEPMFNKFWHRFTKDTIITNSLNESYSDYLGGKNAYTSNRIEELIKLGYPKVLATLMIEYTADRTRQDTINELLQQYNLV